MGNMVVVIIFRNHELPEFQLVQKLLLTLRSKYEKYGNYYTWRATTLNHSVIYKSEP